MEDILLLLIILIILKLQFKMSDIQSIIASAESENQTITALAGVITTLVQSYVGLQNQVATLQGQIKNGVSVSQQQLDLLQEDITAGQTAAAKALADAQAAIAPAPVTPPAPPSEPATTPAPPATDTSNPSSN